MNSDVSDITDVRKLFAWSGETEIESVTYSGGVLKLKCYFNDLDVDVNLEIKTKRLYCTEITGCEGEDGLFGYGRFKFEDLSVLNTLNGFYVPDPDFGKFMKECRKTLNLVYGKREKSCELLLLKSAAPLISCVVDSVDDVTFRIVDM